MYININVLILIIINKIILYFYLKDNIYNLIIFI